jgi:vacuolar-type H+-ATPase subunit I/STV1
MEGDEKMEVTEVLDPMQKMWASLYGIGLMVFAALLITFVRLKTKGVIRFLLSTIAFICLITGMVLGLIAII